MDALITLGYYVSSVGFLIAAIYSYDAARKSSASGLKNVLEYLFIGTSTFFVITIFQKIAELGLYNIEDSSVDIWWHLMFYLAMFSFYFSFKALAGLGSVDGGAVAASTGAAKTWGIISAVVLVAIFILPNIAESFVQTYVSSRLAELGLHHFLAFAMAGVVGAYVFSAKIFLGQIGRAIGGPMVIAIWALALQHLWELLTESWKVIDVPSATVEGVEKIFLTITALCIIYVVLRLKPLIRG